jgi:hypothetical protein
MAVPSLPYINFPDKIIHRLYALSARSEVDILLKVLQGFVVVPLKIVYLAENLGHPRVIAVEASGGAGETQGFPIAAQTQKAPAGNHIRLQTVGIGGNFLLADLYSPLIVSQTIFSKGIRLYLRKNGRRGGQQKQGGSKA